MSNDIDVDGVFRLKVEELKQELAKRGLTKSGSKVELQERLLQFITSPANRGRALIKSLEQDIDPTTEDELLNKPLDHSIDSDNELNSGKEEDKFESDLEEEEQRLIEDEEDESIITDDPIADEVHIEYVEEKPAKAIKDFKHRPVKIVSATVKPPDTKTSTEISDEPKPASPSKIIIKPSSDNEKRDSRTKRFGCATNEVDKKKSRIERFSIGDSTSDNNTSAGLSSAVSSTNGDADRISKRTERFGVVSSDPVQSTSDKVEQRKSRFMDDKMKKRQERFGVITPSISSPASDSEKKNARLLKFATGST